jgi:hypothetical protein
MCVGYIDESRKRGANVNVFVETVQIESVATNGEGGKGGQGGGMGGERVGVGVSVGVGTRRQGCVGRFEKDIDQVRSKFAVWHWSFASSDVKSDNDYRH